jgi:gamma-glutamyltranspeptidase/glutathione hydrolase
LLSKAYAKERAKLLNMEKNDAMAGPGDPYPFEGKTNPYLSILKQRGYDPTPGKGNALPAHDRQLANVDQLPVDDAYMDRLWRGTTSVEAADTSGWVVSITPSGGWLPACIAGNTGIGMSQRMQSFVLDPMIDPFNVVEPGKRPRVTLTPSLALKDGKPLIALGYRAAIRRIKTCCIQHRNLWDGHSRNC